MTRWPIFGRTGCTPQNRWQVGWEVVHEMMRDSGTAHVSAPKAAVLLEQTCMMRCSTSLL